MEESAATSCGYSNPDGTIIAGNQIDFGAGMGSFADAMCVGGCVGNGGGGDGGGGEGINDSLR